jgi:AGZA family xanthine/uracil permease-like MFS transporter
MLFVPLAYFIPAAATAPALIIVGFFMITMINKLIGMILRKHYLPF